MTLQLHFRESDWERIANDWNAWWEEELDRPLVVLECVEPEDRYDLHFSWFNLGNFPFEMPADEILNEFVPCLEHTHFLGDSFPRFWPNFGPGITAAFTGAEVHPAWDTTWFSPGYNGLIRDLHISCNWQNFWWQRVCAVLEAAAHRWKEQLAVGFPDLGGNLDILSHLYGAEELLLSLIDTPQELDRLVTEVTSLWLGCYEKLYAIINTGKGVTCWGPLWSEGRGYMLQSDTAYMISPTMFERFVLPDLDACCASMEYAFYHLDGKGQLPHLDLLLSLPNLRGIQWVPGEGYPAAEHWLALLSRIRAAGKLCQVTVTPEGALTILRELGGKGFCFAINEPRLTPAEGEAFLQHLRQIK